MAVVKSGKTRISTWILDDDGILRATVMPGVLITVEDAKECVSIGLEALGEGRYAMLAHVENAKGISKRAREVFANPGESNHMKAVALVVNSSVARVIGNFFMGRNKPHCPVRLFTTETDAVAWLREALSV